MKNENSYVAGFCESPIAVTAQTSQGLNSIISIPPSPSISFINHSLIDDESVSLSLTNPLTVDWSDVSQLNRYQRCFSEEQQRALNILNRKQSDYHHQIFGNYLENARFVVASDVNILQRLANCGRPEGVGTVFCGKPMLCSHCAKRDEWYVQQRFKNVFSKGTFHFVTFSFTGDLPFDSASSHKITEHWKAVNASIRHLYEQGMINGAYWIDELSVRQFLPLRVLPHGHAIIDADRFNEEHFEEIRSFIRDHHPEIELALNLQSKRLASASDFERRISYCNKAINLNSPYQTAADTIRSSESKSFEPLNREMRELIEGILVEPREFSKVLYCGTMRPQYEARYIGNRVSKKKSKKEKKNPLLRKSK